MSYTEVRNLPLRYRRWFLERLLKHFETQREKHSKPPQDSSKKEISGKVENSNEKMKKIDKFFKKF